MAHLAPPLWVNTDVEAMMQSGPQCPEKSSAPSDTLSITAEGSGQVLAEMTQRPVSRN